MLHFVRKQRQYSVVDGVEGKEKEVTEVKREKEERRVCLLRRETDGASRG